MAYKQQKFICNHSGGWWVQGQGRFGIWGELASWFIHVFTWWKDKEYFWGHFIRVLIPFLRAPPSWAHYLTKTLPPNTTTLGFNLQYVNFGKTQTFSAYKVAIFKNIFLSTVYKGSNFFISSLIFVTVYSVLFFDNGHHNRYEVITHCGFGFHLPDNWWY